MERMGGGSLVRSVVRGAGSTTGFYGACRCQVARPSSLRTVCHHTALSQQVAATSSNQGHVEDWELADETSSESAKSSNALPFSHTSSVLSSHSSAYLAEDAASFENQFWRDVFSLPPSLEEANAATSELQAALFSSKYAGRDEMSRSPSSNTTASEDGGPSTHLGSDRDVGGEWVEPQLFMSQVHASSPAEEAFQLLQSDPNVKGAVISIVSDPDVWHAMMKNEKVQELKRIFQKSQERHEDKLQEQPSSKNNKHNCFDGVSFLLRSIVGLSRQVVWQVQDDISKIIVSIMSLVAGPKFESGKEDPFEKTMRSSMMIAVLVVTVVIMKRMQV